MSQYQNGTKMGPIQFGVDTSFHHPRLLLSTTENVRTRKIQEKTLLQELENIDNKEHIKLSDFYFGQKGWAKLVIKHGAKRAALFYGLCIAIGSTMLLWLFSWGFAEGLQPGWRWLEFIVIFSALYFYHQRKIFEKALGDLNEKTDRCA